MIKLRKSVDIYKQIIGRIEHKFDEKYELLEERIDQLEKNQKNIYDRLGEHNITIKSLERSMSLIIKILLGILTVSILSFLKDLFIK